MRFEVGVHRPQLFDETGRHGLHLANNLLNAVRLVPYCQRLAAIGGGAWDAWLAAARRAAAANKLLGCDSLLSSLLFWPQQMVRRVVNSLVSVL